MRKIRVLIVDDAVVVRRMLTDILASDPAIEVAGVAANGRIALVRIPQVNPDLITLDVEMPEMNGLEALAEIRKLYPFLPVIMFSTLTERGAVATLDALSLGANDYVSKPANVGSVTAAQRQIREQLIPKVKALCKGLIVLQDRPAQPYVMPTHPGLEADRTKARRPSWPVNAVAIGVSTGGPNALAEVIPQIPADFPVPIFIVQHMPPLFTRLLSERLASKSQIKVAEAAAGIIVQPGQAWVAPGDFHMTVAKVGAVTRILTNQNPPENSCRPSVDALFRSVAQVYGAGTLAVVMTGMGQDGLLGCTSIHDAGGQILAQDEQTSVVWGMPGFVVKAGLADAVLPLGKLASEIVRRVRESRSIAV
jgi:two-component system, chemotaxis family, protein-glutamate methylesterase/glutaminase